MKHVTHMIIQFLYFFLGPTLQRGSIGQYGIAFFAKH